MWCQSIISCLAVPPRRIRCSTFYLSCWRGMYLPAPARGLGRGGGPTKTNRDADREGHAKISIQLDDEGQVELARFHVTEFRGFEKLCEGRPFQEMPGLMSRTCGICPVSHVLASSKAGDMLLGVTIPPAAEKQRRLLNYAQILQSHALSFFHLSSPDFLMGMDAPPAERNIFGLL